MWRKRDDGYFKLHTNVRRRWRMKRKEREKMIKREERHGSNTRRKDEFL